MGDLGEHQSESGIVTDAEKGLSARWADQMRRFDQVDREEWLQGWLGTGLPFAFRIGGQSSDDICRDWSVTSESSDGVRHRFEYQWIDPASRLRVTWHLLRFEDFPAVEWYLTFWSPTGSSTHERAIVSDVQALRLKVRHASEPGPFHIHGAMGGRSLPDDLFPFSYTLPDYAAGADDEITRLTLGGPPTPEQTAILPGHVLDELSSSRHLPFFNLDTGENHGLFVGIGWSGGWRASMTSDGMTMEAEAGLRTTAFRLNVGERIRSPRILTMMWEGKRLHGHNMFRRLLHQHYVPKLRQQLMEPLVSVNTAHAYNTRMGFLGQATENDILPLLDPFTELGAELLIIDAGYGDGEPYEEWVGDWRVSATKYPAGLRPIADHLSKSDALLGLWFSPEDVSENSSTYRTHRDWVRPGGWYGHRLRIELPEVRDSLLQDIESIIDEAGLGCYRQDGGGGYGGDEPDRLGTAESQHILGLYALWDELAARYPDLVMEGCCGGGNRIDLETVSRFHWNQKSDRVFDAESDQCSLYGANLFLPGGFVSAATRRLDDYGCWSSFGGQLCIGWHPLTEEFPTEQAKKQVERYKRIRKFLRGDFYPLTPCSLDEPWIGYQFHRTDLDSGIALLFRRDAKDCVLPSSPQMTARLRGLDPSLRYDVTSEGEGQTFVRSGEELSGGHEVSIHEAPGAELLIYSAI